MHENLDRYWRVFMLTRPLAAGVLLGAIFFSAACGGRCAEALHLVGRASGSSAACCCGQALSWRAFIFVDPAGREVENTACGPSRIRHCAARGDPAFVPVAESSAGRR